MASFLEIHYVAITLNKNDDIDGREIFGTVEAVDTYSRIVIYKETKESCKPLLPGGTLYLTGPSRPINAPDFCLKMFLKDKQTDNEVSCAYYNMLKDPPKSWYNKPLYTVFKGDHGDATLCATMFSSGVPVTLKLVLAIDTEGPQMKKIKLTGVEDDSKSLHAIHGTVYARLKNENELFRRTLFSSFADHPKNDVNSEEFTLSRSLIVVPEYSTFIIEADLWKESGVSGIRDEVAKFTVDFKDENENTYRRPEIEQDHIFQGAAGIIKVIATWHSDMNPDML